MEFVISKDEFDRFPGYLVERLFNKVMSKVERSGVEKSVWLSYKGIRDDKLIFNVVCYSLKDNEHDLDR